MGTFARVDSDGLHSTVKGKGEERKERFLEFKANQSTDTKCICDSKCELLVLRTGKNLSESTRKKVSRTR